MSGRRDGEQRVRPISAGHSAESSPRSFAGIVAVIGVAVLATLPFWFGSIAGQDPVAPPTTTARIASEIPSELSYATQTPRLGSISPEAASDIHSELWYATQTPRLGPPPESIATLVGEPPGG
jgi:hypothetical protein